MVHCRGGGSDPHSESTCQRAKRLASLRYNERAKELARPPYRQVRSMDNQGSYEGGPHDPQDNRRLCEGRLRIHSGCGNVKLLALEDTLLHDERTQQPSLLHCTHFPTVSTVLRMTNMLSSRLKSELASFELSKSFPELRRYITSFLIQQSGRLHTFVTALTPVPRNTCNLQPPAWHSHNSIDSETDPILSGLELEKESTWWSSTSKAFVTGCCRYYLSPAVL